jgi:hypothetical protein
VEQGAFEGGHGAVWGGSYVVYLGFESGEGRGCVGVQGEELGAKGKRLFE